MQIIKGLCSYGLKANALLIDDQNNVTLIDNIEDRECKAIDCHNQYAILPGLLDAHIHGNKGFDFADQDLNSQALAKIAESIGQSGVSYCMPTLVSKSLEKLKSNLQQLDIYIAQQNMYGTKAGNAQFIGVHLEGPFIATNCKGAHDETVLQKEITLELFIEIIMSAPHIDHWKITLAPELDGAIQFIQDTRNLTINGRKITVNVFIGHTNADASFLEAAFNAGASGFTHLGNANCETAHRMNDQITESDLNSNVVKFALGHENKSRPIYFELIADNYHLSPSFVNFVLKDRDNKIILITDALGPTGLSDGKYMLGTLPIEKKGDAFYLQQSNKLAGSATSLPIVMQKFSKTINKEGPALWDILFHATVINPRKTSLPPLAQLNDRENFVVLDQTGQLMLSVCNGKACHHTKAFTKTIASRHGYFVTKRKATSNVLKDELDAPLNSPY